MIQLARRTENDQGVCRRIDRDNDFCLVNGLGVFNRDRGWPRLLSRGGNGRKRNRENRRPSEAQHAPKPRRRGAGHFAGGFSLCLRSLQKFVDRHDPHSIVIFAVKHSFNHSSNVLRRTPTGVDRDGP